MHLWHAFKYITVHSISRLQKSDCTLKECENNTIRYLVTTEPTVLLLGIFDSFIFLQLSNKSWVNEAENDEYSMYYRRVEFHVLSNESYFRFQEETFSKGSFKVLTQVIKTPVTLQFTVPLNRCWYNDFSCTYIHMQMYTHIQLYI